MNVQFGQGLITTKAATAGIRDFGQMTGIIGKKGLDLHVPAYDSSYLDTAMQQLKDNGQPYLYLPSVMTLGSDQQAAALSAAEDSGVFDRLV